MVAYPIHFDLHTHSIHSGHGSTDSIDDLVRSAARKGLSALGISDHGPATTGSAPVSYFKALSRNLRENFGIRIYYGAELNILNENGDVDLEDTILETLDYSIISIHPPTFTPWACQDLTETYIRAMDHPSVRFLGHIDDARFPSDYEKLLTVAKEKHIYPEINNLSLAPDAYRVGGHDNCMKILSLCKRLKLPVLLSSDSHGKTNVGNMEFIFPLLKACDFPADLILNCDRKKLLPLLDYL